MALPPQLFRADGTHCYGVEFSPFGDGRMALATSQYFGIVGNGRQYILSRGPGGAGISTMRVFDSQDGLYDCAFNESNPDQVVSASGDGSIKLWDLNTRDDFPIQNFAEHTQECASVAWNLVRKDCFVTASWDGTCKVWFPGRPASACTFAEHGGPAYNAIWSPRSASTFVSCSGDGTAKVWDVNAPQRSSCTIAAHPNEVLAVDWNKYDEFCVVTGSVDRSIRAWDLRRPGRPTSTLLGHEYAIRRLKCSPHDGRIVASVSYDMSVIVWNIGDGSIVSRGDHHSEFVLGVDFDLFQPGVIASCSWDQHACVYDFARGAPPAKIPRVASGNAGTTVP